MSDLFIMKDDGLTRGRFVGTTEKQFETRFAMITYREIVRMYAQRLAEDDELGIERQMPVFYICRKESELQQFEVPEYEVVIEPDPDWSDEPDDRLVLVPATLYPTMTLKMF